MNGQIILALGTLCVILFLIYYIIVYGPAFIFNDKK